MVSCLTSDPDCMTSPNSTTVYSEPDLKKILGYVKHIKRVGGDFGFSACVVGDSNVTYPIWRFSLFFSGRLMSFFGKSVLVNGRNLGP